MKKIISVVILYYAGAKEDDVDTIEGVKGIEESLKRSKYPVEKVRVTETNWEQAVKTPGDVVFNFVEDDSWELYVKVGRRLENSGRAQVGHDLASFGFAIKKVEIKRRLKESGIPTPNFKIFNLKSTEFDGLRYPVIIKPSEQHAGIGISQHSVVTNDAELKKGLRSLFKMFPGEVIAEEYVAGREIHVTIIGNGDNLQVFPLCEIRFGGKFTKNWSVYTYDAKWDKKSWEYWDARVESPAKISRDLADKVKRLALKAYRSFGFKDIGRFDARVNRDNEPYLVDLNVNPSLNYYDEQDATLVSVYAAGWTYDRFIKTLVNLTYDRIHRQELKRTRKYIPKPMAATHKIATGLKRSLTGV